MPQTTIPFTGIAGQPGRAFDMEASNRDVVSILAAVNIPFGAYCELNSSGLAVPMQDSTTGGSFSPKSIGVCMIDPLGVEENYQVFTVPNAGTGSTSSGYLAGQSVPFLRKGRIWVLGDGNGTVTQYGAINVLHSSTGAFSQGVFTFTAVSSTAGHEIDIAPSSTVWNPGFASSVAAWAVYSDVFGNNYYTIPVEMNL